MKRTSLFLVIVITVAMLVQTFSFAWMSDNGLSSIINVSGAVHKNYFAYGDGSKETPYGIANPVQLYYFAWLQYLGYFNNTDNNKDGFRDPFYFELDPKIKEDPKLKGVLDMKGYKLPPIGTIDNPFIGSFDGNGVTIANLTVKNFYDELSAPPSGTDKFGGADIIGFFGVIGSISGDDYKYETLENEVKNLILKDITIETQTEKTLIGLVAGYVNGKVDCVGVLGGTISIVDKLAALTYTENLSDYSLIGYCTKEFRKSVYTVNLSLALPGATDDPYNLVPDMTGEGQQQGWGGSVKMSDIYAWLTNVSGNAQTVSFITERVDIVDLGGKTVTIQSENKTANRDVYTINDFGSFVFTDSTPDYVNFVSGSSKVTKYEYVRDDKASVPLYYITDGTYYLCYNNGNITSTTDRNQATAWYVSDGTNGGNIYVVENNKVLYLASNSSGSLIVTEMAPTVAPNWAKSGGTFAIGGMRLICENGNWTVSSFRISYNNNYLTNNNTNGITNTTTANSAAQWRVAMANGGYQIYTVINGTTYYLGYTVTNNYGGTNVSGPNLSRTPSTWQIDSNNRLHFTTTSTDYRGNTTTRVYNLRLNSSYNRTSWALSYNDTSNSNLTFTSISDDSVSITTATNQTGAKITVETSQYIDNDVVNGYYDENGEKQGTNAGITYFPLSSDIVWNANKTAITSFDVSDNNTGYIIGADWDLVDREAHPDRIDSNIRISRYDDTQSGISDDEAKVPYIISYNTGGIFKKLSEPFPRNESELTDKQRQELLDLGLVKFASCYDDYLTSVEDAWNGIHFMNAPISASNVAKITAELRGEKIDNYEVPLNCIDFNLYESGFINTVAGSYYTQGGGNTSFFSIYEVIRNENDERDIVEIREIYKIYGVVKNKQIDTSVEYVYTYVAYDSNGDKYEVDANGNPVTNGIDGKTMIFDCDWITKTAEKKISGWGTGNVYYFEVPVNAGEYAIGSTEGENGAYLVYLDLAANAQLLEREKTYEEITENSATSTIPNGVDFIAPGEAVESDKDKDYSGSAFVQINNGTSGKITYEKDDNGISHSATSGTTAEYVGVNGTLLDGNGNVMTVPWDSETLIKRTTYRDYNVNTSVTTVTVIDEIHITKDGKTTIKYTKDVTITDAQGNVTVKPQEKSDDKPLSPDTKDEDTSPKLSAGEKLIDIAFAYGTELEDLTVSYLYTPGVKDENGNLTTPTYVITIINPGTGPITVKAILTELGAKPGITFVISDGTTENILTKTTDPQLITINSSGAGGESGEGGDVVEGG